MQQSLSGDTLELSITAIDRIVKHNDLCDLKTHVSLMITVDPLNHPSLNPILLTVRETKRLHASL